MPRLLHALAAAALALGGATTATANTAQHDITVRLVSPDGVVPGAAVVRMMVIDGFVRGQATQIHVAHPDDAGWVALDFPYDDPYVRSHPDQRDFNVELDVALPGPRGLQAVTATTLVFDRVAHEEVTVQKVSGTSIVVHALPAVPRASGPDAANGPTLAANTGCDQDLPEWECAITTEPDNMTYVPVVFANNAGAGFDTELKITYDRAGRTQTTVAADLGAGITEVGGAVSVNNTDTTTVTYGDTTGAMYGQPNEWAVVLTKWSETNRYHCTKPNWPFAGSPECEADGTEWAPVRVTGYDQRVSPYTDDALWHDRICPPTLCPVNPDQFCVEQYYDGYALGHGQEVSREYTAGIDVSGTIEGVKLHASVTYGRTDTTTTSTVYSYRAQHPYNPNLPNTTYTHFLFVHQPVPGRNNPGGGQCPSNDVGDVWTTTSGTSATTVPDETQTMSNTANQTFPPGSPAATAVKGAGHCRYEPDDCRPT